MRVSAGGGPKSRKTAPEPINGTSTPRFARIFSSPSSTQFNKESIKVKNEMQIDRRIAEVKTPRECSKPTLQVENFYLKSHSPVQIRIRRDLYDRCTLKTLDLLWPVAIHLPKFIFAHKLAIGATRSVTTSSAGTRNGFSLLIEMKETNATLIRNKLHNYFYPDPFFPDRVAKRTVFPNKNTTIQIVWRNSFVDYRSNILEEHGNK